jgi:hypothetical protein
LAAPVDASALTNWHRSGGPAVARFPDLPPDVLDRLAREAEQEARARKTAAPTQANASR